MLDGIKDSIKGRLDNPFLGSFIFSFIFCNWKYWLIVTTGELSPSQRIEQIQALLNSKHSSLTFSEPLFLALVFTILYPLLSGLINYCYHAVKLFEENKKDRLTEKLDDEATRILRRISEIAKENRTKLTNLENYVRTHLIVTGFNPQIKIDIINGLMTVNSELQPIEQANLSEIRKLNKK